MELHHLRRFSVLAEELHFTRAAERLHIEQSPLSRTIMLPYEIITHLVRLTKRGHDAHEHFERRALQVAGIALA